MISINDTREISKESILQINGSICFIGASVDERGAELIHALKNAGIVIKVSF